jgi:hypothetical protein
MLHQKIEMKCELLNETVPCYKYQMRCDMQTNSCGFKGIQQ